MTLIFSERQYEIARENVFRGAQSRPGGLDSFKSVYSIFVSRVNVYTEKQVPDLSPAAQGQVGIVNVKRIWRSNQAWWKPKNLKLQQEIVFASTGTKKPTDPPDKYVAALAGSDIQTNPPATNEAVEKLNKKFTRQIDQMPPDSVLKEIDQKVDVDKMEKVLMEEGTKKFSDPQHALLKLIGEKRAELAPRSVLYIRSRESQLALRGSDESRFTKGELYFIDPLLRRSRGRYRFPNGSKRRGASNFTRPPATRTPRLFHSASRSTVFGFSAISSYKSFSTVVPVTRSPVFSIREMGHSTDPSPPASRIARNASCNERRPPVRSRMRTSAKRQNRQPPQYVRPQVCVRSSPLSPGSGWPSGMPSIMSCHIRSGVRVPIAAREIGSR